MTDVFHPFYCVWCGKTLPNKEEFDKHYQAELKRMDEEDKNRDVFDEIHNPDKY